ncbi:hypothetical protein BgiBS90_016128, partial [Biomphalaria glabrata]
FKAGYISWSVSQKELHIPIFMTSVPSLPMKCDRTNRFSEKELVHIEVVYESRRVQSGADPLILGRLV